MKQILLPLLLLLCSAIAPAADCKQPLDGDTLERLRLGVTDVQLHPGDSHRFALAIFRTYAPANEVAACATWKVDPEGKGATIDSEGVLKIGPKTPPGAKFIVTADIEHGRAQRQVPVVVYTEAAQPLVGLWQQQARSDCDAQKDAAPPKPIHELEFRAGGWFSVTWTPFETYRDYWGSYTADNSTGAISLQIENGNYVPSDFHGAGKFKRKDNNTIELTGIYLGEPRGAAPVKEQKTTRRCHYVFTRIR